MRYLLFLSGVVLLPFFIFAQSNREISINFGIHQTNSHGYYSYYYFDEGGYITKQNKATFFDLNVLVSNHPEKIIKVQGRAFDVSRFGFTYGLGINQKGFVQTGMASDGTAHYNPYLLEFTRNYVSLYMGLSYDLIHSKKIKVTVGSLVNPDFDLQKIVPDGPYMKTIAFGLRSFFAVQYELNAKSGIRLSPYYQCSLSSYDIPYKDRRGDSYRPYGFGLSLGFILL